MRITQDVIQRIQRAYAEAGMGLTSTVRINKTTTAQLRLGTGNVMNPRRYAPSSVAENKEQCTATA